MAVKSYQELVVWQKAMDLVEMIYQVSQGFPKEEVFGLTSQIRRAAVSIPSNIAEGQGRNSTKEFRRYLSIAYGSLQEVETQILIASRLGYLPQSTQKTLIQMTEEVGRLSNGLSNALLRRQAGH